MARLSSHVCRLLFIAAAIPLASCIKLTSYHQSPLDLTTNVPKCQVINAAPCVEVRAMEFTDRGNLFDHDHFTSLSERIKSLSETHNAAVNVVVYVHGWHHNAKRDDDDLVQFVDRIKTLANAEGFKENPTLGVYIGWRGESFSVPKLNVTTYYGRKRTAEIVGRTGLRTTMLQLESEVQRLGGRFVLIGHSFGTNAVLSGVQGDLIGRANTGSICEKRRLDELQGTQQASDEEIQRRFVVCMRAARFGHGVFLFNPAIEANAFSPLRSGLSGKFFNELQPKLLHVIATRAETGARAAFSVAQTLLNTLWAVDRHVPLNATCVKPNCHDERQLMTTTMGQYAPYWTGSMTAIRDQPGVSTWRFQHIKDGCYSLLLPEDTEVIGGGLKKTAITHQELAKYESQDELCRRRNEQIPPDWKPFEIERHIPARFSDPIQVTIADWDVDNGGAKRVQLMKNHNAQLCPLPFAYIAAAVLENDYHLNSLESALVGYDKTAPKKERSQDRSSSLGACDNKSFDFAQCFEFFRKTFSAEPSALDRERC